MHILAAMKTATSTDQWVWSMTPEAWLTLVAVLLGPILAVQAQKWLERRREDRGKKLWIFRELMVTRGERLSGRHVEALNSIDVEFYGNRDVLEAWQTYFELFVKGRKEDGTEDDHKRWIERGDDLLVDLLFAMAKYLGYHFDKVTLRRRIYSPQGHIEAEMEALLIRKATAELLTGQRRLPMDVDFADDFKEFLANAVKQQQQDAQQAAPSQPRNIGPKK